MINNRHLLFRSEEYCSNMELEFQNHSEKFEQFAMTDYKHIEKGKYEGLNIQLIAMDEATLQKLSGEFSCYCDYQEMKKENN